MSLAFAQKQSECCFEVTSSYDLFEKVNFINESITSHLKATNSPWLYTTFALFGHIAAEIVSQVARIVRNHNLTSILCFFIFLSNEAIELSYEIVVKIFVVPDCEKQAAHANQQTLHATDVWNIIKNGVAVTSNLELAHVHLDRDIQLRVVVFFVWA